MTEWGVVAGDVYNSSVAMIEDALNSQLAALGPEFPNLPTGLLLEEIKRQKALKQKVRTLRSTDKDLKLLANLTASENYYAFHPYLNEFSVYFVLDIDRKALVALLMRRGSSTEGKDLLAALESALRIERQRHA